MKVSITENLECALQYLQHDAAPVTIWIDALCINQPDESEKAEQVTRMKEIYQMAEHVLVWLGPTKNSSDEEIDCLEKISKAAEDLELKGITGWMLMELFHTPDDPYSMSVSDKLEQLYQKFDYLFPDLFPWKAHQDFLSRDWCTRFLVVQELAVGRDATFMCGKKKISYNHLNNADTFFLSHS
jgi:hypothetical protein